MSVIDKDCLLFFEFFQIFTDLWSVKQGMLTSFRSILLFVFAVCSPMGYTLAESSPTIENCSILPSNNIWNTAIDRLPVDPNVRLA